MKLAKVKICDFFLYLLLFTVMIDPTNTIFKVKEVAFSLFILSCVLFRISIDRKMLCILIFCFFSLLFSLFMGHLQCFSFDNAATLGFVKSFLFLAVLLYVKPFNFIQKVINASVCVAILTLIVACIYLMGFKHINLLDHFFLTHDHFIGVNLNRIFLGHKFYSFFYKTSPVLVIPLAFSLYRMFNKKQHKIWYFFLSVCFFLALLLSGTRANMFSALLIVALLVINQLYKSNFWRSLSVFSLIFFALIGLTFIVIMLKDNDFSIRTKSLHLVSIFEVFKEHPLILLFGQGPGSLYYSSGVNEYVYISEVTYLEIIRIFGLFLGGGIIAMFIYPLIIAYKRRTKLKEYTPFYISYLAYLFIGGTNPLLIGSTGFLVLATAYSFSLRIYSDDNAN